jgi:hypothetical protein
LREALLEKWDNLRNRLFSRQRAYLHTFDQKNLFAQEVLGDLAKFCRANESTFHSDPRAHAVLEGRREVWLRIQHHLKLDSDAIWKHYGRKDLE